MSIALGLTPVSSPFLKVVLVSFALDLTAMGRGVTLPRLGSNSTPTSSSFSFVSSAATAPFTSSLVGAAPSQTLDLILVGVHNGLVIGVVSLPLLPLRLSVLAELVQLEVELTLLVRLGGPPALNPSSPFALLLGGLAESPSEPVSLADPFALVLDDDDAALAPPA